MPKRKPKAIPDEQAALLRAIVAQPDEDTPRLVYADWLQEHSDEEQARFIRDSIKLSHMKKDAHGRKTLAKRLGQDDPERALRWVKLLGAPNAVVNRYDRGFPVRVGFSSADEFFATVEVMFAFVPLRRLTIGPTWGNEFTDESLPHLAALPGLARIHSLELVGQRGIGATAWRELFRSPHLAGLEYLGLPECDLSRSEVEELASAPLTKLIGLDLSDNSIGVGGARAILNSPHLKKLKTLWLEENFNDPDDDERKILDALEKRLGAGFHPHDSPDEDSI